MIETRRQKQKKELAKLKESTHPKLASGEKRKTGPVRSDKVVSKNATTKEDVSEFDPDDEEDGDEISSEDTPETTPKSKKKKKKTNSKENEKSGRPKNEVLDMSNFSGGTRPQLINKKLNGVLVQRFLCFHPENFRPGSIHAYTVLCKCGENGAISTMSKHFKECKQFYKNKTEELQEESMAEWDADEE